MEAANKKNIAIMTSSLNNGGAERMAANMSIALSEKYNVYLFSFSKKNIKYPYGGSLVTYDSANDRRNIFVHALSLFLRIRETKRLKKKYRIDCTISHQDRPNLINVFSRYSDKKICCLHTSPISVMKPDSKRAFLQRLACRLSFRYIAVSKKAASDLSEVFGFKKDKVRCIYNFVDTELISGLMREPISDREYNDFARAHKDIIIYVGRLIPSKGHAHLIRAFKEVKKSFADCGIVFLGEGDERKNITELAESLGVSESIYMPGNVDNPYQYISKASVFVMPSEYEGLPMVLIEAAACGCPIISCDISTGPREILDPDSDIDYRTDEIQYAEYGILVPDCRSDKAEETEKREQMLADSIVGLLSDPEMRRRYSESSSECVKRFNVETIVSQWEELIEE